jgi:hypothetical protein
MTPIRGGPVTVRTIDAERRPQQIREDLPRQGPIRYSRVECRDLSASISGFLLF